MLQARPNEQRQIDVTDRWSWWDIYNLRGHAVSDTVIFAIATASKALNFAPVKQERFGGPYPRLLSAPRQ